jgi:hypothetical protein
MPSQHGRRLCVLDQITKVGLQPVTLRPFLMGSLASKKCHRRLKRKSLPPAFQADDEGSIPFTRSNFQISGRGPISQRATIAGGDTPPVAAADFTPV